MESEDVLPFSQPGATEAACLSLCFFGVQSVILSKLYLHMFHISAGLPGGTFRAFEDIAVSMSNVSHTSWNYFFFLDN